jgi:hypothetical protein
MSSLDLTQLNATLGEYCEGNQEVLLQGLVIDSHALKHMTPLANVADQQAILDVAPGDIVKPYSATWEPAEDTIPINPRVLKVRPCKVEVRLDPIAYKSTYLGHFLQPGVTPENLPFEKFLMDKVISKAKEQIELKAIFKGVYNAAGTTPGATLDGLEKIVTDEITATNITPVTIGAIDATNAVAKLELLFDEVPEEYQQLEWKMFVSPEVAMWYNRKYRTDYGNVTHNEMFTKKFIDGTNCQIVAMPGMAGQQRIHLSPKWNFYYGVDLESDMNRIHVQRDHWYLDVMMSFSVGVQIGSLDYYLTNDAA